MSMSVFIPPMSMTFARGFRGSGLGDIAQVVAGTYTNSPNTEYNSTNVLPTVSDGRL